MPLSGSKKTSSLGSVRRKQSSNHLERLTQFLALARPIEGARTGFDDHCARIDLCEDCEKLITHHPALQDDVAAAIDAADRPAHSQGGPSPSA
jgi:hypothetical protein